MVDIARVPAVRLSPLVRRLVAPNPSLMTGPGTNTYLVGAGEVTVIDPGPDDEVHLGAVLDALERGPAGPERIAAILLTHGHPDHAPGAGPLAQRTGAPVLAHTGSLADARSGGGAAPQRPDGPLRDGEVLTGPGFGLEVLHTPGHASDHLCFLLREERALFSGDLIMSGSTVVIAPPDGDMAAYMRSLERLTQRHIARIYPGHGEVIETPAALIEEYIQHRRMREQQVLDALRDGPSTIAGLVPRIYADVPAALHPLAARSVHAHLIKLEAEGRVSGTDQESLWQLI